MTVHVRSVQSEDFFSWLDMYHEYAQNNEHPLTDEKTLQAWMWITDPERDLEAFIAYDAHNTPVALAHTREFLVPFGATKGIDIDSVFVKSAHDQDPIYSALDTFIRGLAKERDYSIIRTLNGYQDQYFSDTGSSAHQGNVGIPSEERHTHEVTPDQDTTWSTLPAYIPEPEQTPPSQEDASISVSTFMPDVALPIMVPNESAAETTLPATYWQEQAKLATEHLAYNDTNLDKSDAQ